MAKKVIIGKSYSGKVSMPKGNSKSCSNLKSFSYDTIYY